MNNFNFNENPAMKHAEHFWQYLDELAEKDPVEYKNFIQKQVTKGANEFKKGINQDNNEEKGKGDNIENKSMNNVTHTNNTNTISSTNIINNTVSVKVQPAIVMRFKTLKEFKNNNKDNKINTQNNTIKLFENQEDQLKEIQKMKIGPTFIIPQNVKVLTEPKVYLNIVLSDQVVGPLDKFNKPAPLDDDKEWAIIPTIIRFNGSKNSMLGTRCDFYDLCVNTYVFQRSCTDEKLNKSMLAFFVKQFVYNIQDKYELFIQSIKLLGHKKYKSVDYIPPDFKLQEEGNLGKGGYYSDKNSANNRLKDNSNNIKIMEQEPEQMSVKESLFNIASMQNKSSSNSNTLPINNLNFTNQNKQSSSQGIQSNQGNQNKQNMPITKQKPIDNKEISIDTLKLPSDIKTKQTLSEGKKIVIEEIQPEKNISKNVTKETKINSKKEIKFFKTVNTNKDQIELIFDFKDLDKVSLNDVDFEVSTSQVKIQLINNNDYDLLTLNITEFVIDEDKTEAKFNKVNRTLKVILNK